MSYLQAKLPVLAVTDVNSDVGNVIEKGSFGWWCESNNEEKFKEIVSIAANSDTEKMGNAGFNYLKSHYSVEQQYLKIVARVQ